MFTHSHYSYIFYSTVCCLSPRYACCSAAWHQPRPTFSCAARSAGNFCASTHVHPRTPQSATAVLRATATKDEAASLVGPYCNCGWQLSVLPNRTFSSDRVIFANFVSYISAQDGPKFRAHFAQPASAQISKNISRNSGTGQGATQVQRHTKPIRESPPGDVSAHHDVVDDTSRRRGRGIQ